MNYDLSLISAILETRDLSEVQKNGLKPAMLSQEAKGYWDIIMGHFEQFHEVPSVEYFQGMIPSYEHLQPDNSIVALVHEVKTRYLNNELDTILQKIAELNGKDPWTAKTELIRLIEGVSIEVQTGNTDLIAGEDKESVFRTIEMLQGNLGLLGFPWPWEFLNRETSGLVPGNFIYLYGREKSKKTFILIFMALFWEMLGYRVLFCTREMSREEIAWRMYCMRALLPYHDLIRGDISTDGKHTLEMAMDELFEHKNLIVTEIDGGIAGLQAKIDEVKPHIVIHDYMKALADDEMGDKISSKEHVYIGKVADRVKNRIAMNPKRKVVFFGCGHANRDGEKNRGKTTTDVAHADHIARKADIVIRVVADDVMDRIGLIITAGRSMRKYLAWTISGRLCNGFGELLGEDAAWVDQTEKMKEAEEESKEANKEKIDAMFKNGSKPLQGGQGKHFKRH